LEEHSLQLSLPYLEAGEDRIFDDADFLGDIKKAPASLHCGMIEHAPEAAMEVWTLVDQSVSALTIPAKAADVLRLAVAVMVVRCVLENIRKPGEPISVSRSRSHPAFHSKLRDACPLFDLPDDSKLGALAAMLGSEVNAK
jgi:hypothetical protein